ncbi:hypothetical protein FB446DRAFT_794251 [Lentinula raphanica]|nr:hypothetical protein FB446DRAFT_794251 [Lentinula raphanica]
MHIAFNPKDPNTFASACLDGTLKVWFISTISSTSSPQANFTLHAHEKGVNYPAEMDKTVKFWDFLSKGCVQIIEAHTNNVSFSVFHPSLPVITSGAEDGTVKVLEHDHTTNEVAVGYDDGSVVIKLGKGRPNLFCGLFWQIARGWARLPICFPRRSPMESGYDA